MEGVLYGLRFPRNTIDLIMICIRTVKFSILINEDSVGFFTGKRGLKQGDLIFPLPFVLCMEYFIRLIGMQIRQNVNFRHHKKCNSMNLVQLSFADDLLIFYENDVESIITIKSSIDMFSSFSGLYPNRSKSEVYFNANNRNNAVILGIMGFHEGCLPIKYLGVPLIPTRLTKNHCNVLIFKITARINHWTTMSLSYAGRLQLINSVLLSMQVYWCSTSLCCQNPLLEEWRLFAGTFSAMGQMGIKKEL
ncbi:uncharacterized protein LOC126674413 [Mercurialis annua]|uniref:uncharacterized protein LOC126674413 n=1 Tax=Mercurialis annua TaxID=3986 RepID=UPI00215E63F1|nr:uncharacterized protein LOC126674413 [Mercurialis annua]